MSSSAKDLKKIISSSISDEYNSSGKFYIFDNIKDNKKSTSKHNKEDIHIDPNAINLISENQKLANQNLTIQFNHLENDHEDLKQKYDQLMVASQDLKEQLIVTSQGLKEQCNNLNHKYDKLSNKIKTIEEQYNELKKEKVSRGVFYTLFAIFICIFGFYILSKLFPNFFDFITKILI